MLYNFDDLFFKILTIDRFIHKDGIVDVNSRPYAALSYRESGTGTFKIGNKILRTKPGDVLFIPANVPYKVEYSSSASIVVNMESCNYSEAEVFEFQSISGISLLFSLLLAEWQENYSVNQAKSKIYSILEKIEEHDKTKIDKPAISDCIQYIDVHFCDPELDIKKLCEVSFLSKSNLYRFFTNRFGISPKQYIIKLRMNKALRLLVDGNISVKEISLSCGFSDDKYFSRIFKSIYGYPPSQLRKFARM